MLGKAEYTPLVRKFEKCPKCKSRNIQLSFTGSNVTPRCVSCGFKPVGFSSGISYEEAQRMDSETWALYGSDEKDTEKDPEKTVEKPDPAKTQLIKTTESSKESGSDDPFKKIGYRKVSEFSISQIIVSGNGYYNRTNVGQDSWQCPKCKSLKVFVVEPEAERGFTLGCAECLNVGKRENALYGLFWELKNGFEQSKMTEAERKQLRDPVDLTYDYGPYGD